MLTGVSLSCKGTRRVHEILLVIPESVLVVPVSELVIPVSVLVV